MPFSLGTQVQGALDDYNHEMNTGESFKRQFASYTYDTETPTKSRILLSPKKSKPKTKTKRVSKSIGSINKQTILKSKNGNLENQINNTLIGSKDWSDIKEKLINGIDLNNTVVCENDYTKGNTTGERHVIRNSYTYPSDLSTEDFNVLYEGFNFIKGGSDEMITLSQALFDKIDEKDVQNKEQTKENEIIEIDDSCDEGNEEGDFVIPNSSDDEIDIISLSSDEEVMENDNVNVNVNCNGEDIESNNNEDDDSDIGNISRLDIISKVINLANPDSTIPDSEVSDDEDIDEFLTARSKIDKEDEEENGNVSHISIMDTTICDNAETSEIDVSFSKVQTKSINEQIDLIDSMESDLNISYSKAETRVIENEKSNNVEKSPPHSIDEVPTNNSQTEEIFNELTNINTNLTISKRIDHFKEWNNTQLSNQLKIWGIKRSSNSRNKLLELIEDICNRINPNKWNWVIENTKSDEPLDFSKYPDDVEPVIITNNIEQVIIDKVIEILEDEKFNYKILTYKPININEILEIINKNGKIVYFKQLGDVLDNLGVCWTEIEN